MRGLACVLMFQTHCYDSWLSAEARKSTFFMWSQLGGTLPAPLFLFLAGISFALVVDKLRQKDLMASQIARTTIRRGARLFRSLRRKFSSTLISTVLFILFTPM